MIFGIEKQRPIPLDSNFEEMLISAERYACGRRTYIVDDTVNYIVQLLPYLSEKTLRVFRNDMASMHGMAERSRRPEIWGDPCDMVAWEKFTESVNSELARRK